MPNLYFCDPEVQGATLHAILSWNICEQIAKGAQAIYIGQKFPRVSPGQSQTAGFAIIGVRSTEVRNEWRAGFYYLNGDPAEISRTLELLNLPT